MGFFSNARLWQTLSTKVKAARHVDAAIAYFGHGGARLLPLQRGHRLIVDLSLATVRAGGSDPREIEKLMRRGVLVFTRRNRPAHQRAASRARGAKMALTQSEAVLVRSIRGKGRGVFARRPIEEGEIIERVPLIVLPAEQVGDDPVRDDLAGYIFKWGRGTVALALGYGSLYNHSYEPNARYKDVRARAKLFVALRAIAAGEEITVNYNGDPEDRSPVWFEVIESSERADCLAPGGE